ncbi:MAG: hypothetical protein N2652_12655 [Kiritimatiellae bacterium]|nr:hypothetical protein [Kiritimatiellia bacterium]
MNGSRCRIVTFAAVLLASAARPGGAPAPTNAPPASGSTTAGAAVDYRKLAWSDGRFLLDGRPFTGVAELRDRDGRLKARYPMRDGQLHGLVEEWYPNGRRSAATWFEHNRRHGTNEYWDADGRLLKRQVWQNDELVDSSDPSDVHSSPPP